MLRLSNLEAGYRSRAVVSIDTEIDPGAITAILGPNGCGKSTLLKTLVGVLRPVDGSISWNGTTVTSWPASKRARSGMGWVPSGGRLFEGLSVRENLQIGFGRRPEAAWTGALERVCSVFPIVGETLDSDAQALSGGQRQAVAIGRALMAGPSLLLLDEPSLGLAPRNVATLMAALASLRDAHGLTVVIVEQNAKAVLLAADRAVILGRGSVLADAPAHELREQPDILGRYLTNSA